MKLSRKNLGRVATTFLATAMLASLTAVPAFAEDKGIYEPGESFTITKNLTVPANVLTPDVTFEFDVSAPNGPVSGTLNGMKIEAGDAGDVTMQTGADFDPETNVDDTANARTVSEKATFKVNLTEYEHAGVYKYTISEKNDNVEGVNYKAPSKDLYVFIQNQTDENGDYIKDDEGNVLLEVAYTMVVEAGEDATIQENKSDSFDNDYGKDPEGDPNVFDLTLTKEITGNAADLGDKFTFKFTVNGNVDGEKYVMLYNGNKTIITEGVEQSVELGDDDSVTIYGLSKSDSYTITEEYGDKTGYSTTATINNGENVLKNGNLDVAYGTGENEDITEAHNVVYTNSRDSAAPTGIAMDIAPYALLVVIAAAGCFVFLRKRNED